MFRDRLIFGLLFQEIHLNIYIILESPKKYYICLTNESLNVRIFRLEIEEMGSPVPTVKLRILRFGEGTTRASQFAMPVDCTSSCTA